MNLKNEILLVIILRWIARIWSIASISFISFFIIAHLFGENFGTFNSWKEVVMFLFFPAGIYVGMLIAWKWEGLGGVMGTGSIVAYHLIETKFYLDFWIDGLAAPGVLFLGCWLLSRNQRLKMKEPN